MATSDLRILGIPGSLRRASYNRAARATAQKLVPAGATLDIVDLDGIPPFDYSVPGMLENAIDWARRMKK